MPILKLLLLILATGITLSLKAQTIKISTGEWPPYTSKSIPDGGIAIKRTAEILQQAGFTPEFTYLPWKRAYNEAKAGKFDASVAWIKTPERERDFIFSALVLSAQNVVFYNRRVAFKWDKEEDLKNYRFGASTGYAYGPIFDGLRKRNQLNVKDASNDLINLKKLIAGRIDAFPCDKAVCEYILQQKFKQADREKLAVFPKPLSSSEYHIILPKKGKHTQALRSKIKE